MQQITHDALIFGTGLAELSAALELRNTTQGSASR